MAARLCFAIAWLFIPRCTLARTYRYPSYAEATHAVHALNERYPQFIEIFSANHAYKLPSAGHCQTAPSGSSSWLPSTEDARPRLRRRALKSKSSEGPCQVWVLRLTDEASLINQAGVERPEVFLSGALHGDERIGPITTLETVRLLVRAASCVQRIASSSTLGSGSNAVSLATLTPAACVELGELSASERRALESGGDEHDGGEAGAAMLGRERLLWLARLVRHRSVCVAYLIPGRFVPGRFVQFSSVQFSSVQFSSVQFSSVPFSSDQFSSVQFSSVQFSSVQFSSVQMSSLQLRARTEVVGCWGVTVISSGLSCRHSPSLGTLALPCLRPNAMI